MRFLRYNPGEYFKPHFDGSYMRTNGDVSYITVQIYLNEVSHLYLESLSDQSLECLIVIWIISLAKGFKGGSTTFLNKFDSKDGGLEVVPKTGKKWDIYMYIACNAINNQSNTSYFWNSLFKLKLQLTIIWTRLLK